MTTFHFFFVVCNLIAQPDAVAPKGRFSIRTAIEVAAQRTLKLRAAQGSSSDEIDELLRRVGELQLCITRRDDAMRTATMIDDDDQKGRLLAPIAASLARAGDFNTCEKLAAVQDHELDGERILVSVRDVVVAELLRIFKYDDAVRIAKLYATPSDQMAALASVASHAAAIGATSQFEAILPLLNPQRTCDVLTIAARKSTSARELLLRARAASLEIEVDHERWSKMVRVAVCFDLVGLPADADETTSQIDDQSKQAYCALRRATNCVRARRNSDAFRLVTLAWQIDPAANLLPVVRAASQAGDFEVALRLVADYACKKDVPFYIKEGVVWPALSDRIDFEGVLTASRLLSDPFDRAACILRAVELKTADAEGNRTFAATVPIVLDEVQILASQIDEPRQRFKLGAQLALCWHAIGNDENARKTLRPLVASVMGDSSLQSEFADHSTQLFPLLDALDSVKMAADLEAVLNAYKTADVLTWRVHALCDQRKFDDALAVIHAWQPGSVEWLETDVVRCVAESGNLQQAFEMVDKLGGDEATVIGRILTVLEAIFEQRSRQTPEARQSSEDGLEPELYPSGYMTPGIF